MRLVLCVLVVLLAGCQHPAPAGSGSEQAVAVRLDQVRVYQYRQGRLRFAFRGTEAVLDEEAGTLRVERGVEGRVEPSMWPGRRP